MKLCKCDRGHFYDKEKFGACPMCADEGIEPVDPAMSEPELPVSEIVAGAMDLPIGGVEDTSNLPIGGVMAEELPIGGVSDLPVGGVAVGDMPIGGVVEDE